MSVHFRIEVERETDGHWIADDHDEIGPRMIARIAKHSGLRPEDL